MKIHNDHQVASVEQTRKSASVSVAWNDHELAAKLDEIEVWVGQASDGLRGSMLRRNS